MKWNFRNEWLLWLLSYLRSSVTGWNCALSAVLIIKVWSFRSCGSIMFSAKTKPEYMTSFSCWTNHDWIVWHVGKNHNGNLVTFGRKLLFRDTACKIMLIRDSVFTECPGIYSLNSICVCARLIANTNKVLVSFT